MNIYRNQTSPFFYCSPASSVQNSFLPSLPIPMSSSSFFQATVVPETYSSGSFLTWNVSFEHGQDIELTQEQNAFSLIPDRLFYLSYFLRAYLPAHTWLEIIPYLDVSDSVSYIRSAHACDLPCWANLSGGFLLPTSQINRILFQVKHNAPSLVTVQGSLHIIPVSL